MSGRTAFDRSLFTAHLQGLAEANGGEVRISDEDLAHALGISARLVRQMRGDEELLEGWSVETQRKQAPLYIHHYTTAYFKKHAALLEAMSDEIGNVRITTHNEAELLPRHRALTTAKKKAAEFKAVRNQLTAAVGQDGKLRSQHLIVAVAGMDASLFASSPNHTAVQLLLIRLATAWNAKRGYGHQTHQQLAVAMGVSERQVGILLAWLEQEGFILRIPGKFLPSDPKHRATRYYPLYTPDGIKRATTAYKAYAKEIEAERVERIATAEEEEQGTQGNTGPQPGTIAPF